MIEKKFHIRIMLNSNIIYESKKETLEICEERVDEIMESCLKGPKIHMELIDKNDNRVNMFSELIKGSIIYITKGPYVEGPYFKAK